VKGRTFRFGAVCEHPGTLFGFSYIAFALDSYLALIPIVERLAGR
jgi:hypothetical protein